MSENTVEEDEPEYESSNWPEFRVVEHSPRTAKQLPIDVIENLEGYLNQGDEPSPFLRAVLESDLRCAGEMAPREVTLKKLHLLADFLYRHSPGNAQGDAHTVEMYLQERASQNRKKAEAKPLVLTLDQVREARVLWGYLQTQDIKALKELEKASPRVREAIRRMQNKIATAHWKLDEENPFEELPKQTVENPTKTHQKTP